MTSARRGTKVDPLLAMEASPWLMIFGVCESCPVSP
jgi:hypothetical protein